VNIIAADTDDADWLSRSHNSLLFALHGKKQACLFSSLF
jgi:hypothetical protein